MAIAVLTGCEDATVDPTALLVAEETRAAIEFAHQVQLLPDLVTKHAAVHLAGPAVDLWTESWLLAAEDGALVRREAYRSAARELVAVTSPIELWDDLAQLEQLVASAHTLGDGPLPLELQLAVDRADDLHARAEEALAQGNLRRALELAFESSDALRAVGPDAVSTRLIRQAEAALEAATRRTSDPPTYDEVELDRAGRMTRGAREAQENGDYELAIRRAFYAWQILREGEPPE